MWVQQDTGPWHYFPSQSGESACRLSFPSDSYWTTEWPTDGDVCGVCLRVATEQKELSDLARHVADYIKHRCMTNNDLSATGIEILTSFKYGLLNAKDRDFLIAIGKKRRKELADSRRDNNHE